MTQPALRATIVGLMMALATLCLLWETVLAPLRPGAWLLALKAVPIIMAIPPMLAGRLRTFQWWSMLILFWLTEGLVRAYADQGLSRPLAIIEICLTALIFAAILWYCRIERARPMNPESPIGQA